MRTYSVHNREGAPAEQATFVPEGFSGGAFVFTVFWALWHRMWLTAGFLLAITGAIAAAGSLFGLGEAVTAIASFVVSLIFGFEARELYVRSLIARGMPQIGLSQGRNLEEAEIRFYYGSGARAAPSARATVAPYVHAPDTLGIFGNV